MEGAQVDINGNVVGLFIGSEKTDRSERAVILDINYIMEKVRRAGMKL